MGTSSACAKTGSMLFPYIAQLAALVDNDIAKAIALTVFGALAFIGGLLSITLPETVNKTLPDTIEEAHHFDKPKVKEITVPIFRKILNSRMTDITQPGAFAQSDQSLRCSHEDLRSLGAHIILLFFHSAAHI